MKYPNLRIEVTSEILSGVKITSKSNFVIQNRQTEAIKVSWQWIHTEESVGEVLYNFLDNEENGFTLFQEIEGHNLE